MNKKQLKIFIISLLGAVWLYLPTLYVATRLPRRFLPLDKEGALPEVGMLPFLLLWAGIIIGGAICWRIAAHKFSRGIWRQSVWLGAQTGLIGALMLTLALPILARGWQGFLLWFQPGLWLIGLGIAAWSILSGATLALLADLKL